MKKLLTCCAMAAAFVALPASAQWYGGVGVGSSKIDGAGGGLDSSKTSAKLYGGYQITPLIGRGVWVPASAGTTIYGCVGRP